jgi:hypothetical protein
LPSTQLVAVVGPWSSEICRMAWPVDDVVEVRFPGFERTAVAGKRIDPYLLLKEQTQMLRKQDARDAIVFRDDAWWAAWLARTAVGGLVVTGDDPRTKNFATHIASFSGCPHRTQIAFEIVCKYLDERSESASVNDWDMSPRLSGRFVPSVSSPSCEDSPRRQIMVHPGSGAPVKSWPVRNWRAVVDQYKDFDVLLTGSKPERGQCEAIAAGFPHATVVAGETSLSELVHLLQRSRVAIGTDNGPMHLAGALGTPTVRLFGPSDAQRFGPYPGTPGQIVVSRGWNCAHCEDLSLHRQAGCGCMLAISPAEVIRQVGSLLDDPA